MNRPYDFEDIEDYLNGRMSDTDRFQFETAMEGDPDLAAEVDAVRAEAKLLRMLRDEALMEQFAAWDNEIDGPERPNPVSDPRSPKVDSNNLSLLKLLLIAGILIAGLGLWGVFKGWFSGKVKASFENQTIPLQDTTSVIETIPGINGEKNKTIAGEKPPVIPEEQPPARKEKQSQRATQSEFLALADQYEIETSAFGEVRKDDTSFVKSNYQKAAEFYNGQKYREALRLLQEPDKSELQRYLYLRAYTYYKLGLFDLAMQDFRTFRKYPLAQKKYDAQWGEVLCLLHTMPDSKATLIDLLEEIIAIETHPHLGKAMELKKALEK